MRYSGQGKIQNIVWLPADITLKYNSIAKEHNKASNVLMAEVLMKAVEKICEVCDMPEVICRCEKKQCPSCKSVFITAHNEHQYCSRECEEFAKQYRRLIAESANQGG